MANENGRTVPYKRREAAILLCRERPTTAGPALD
jgi:hypothetical protein